MNDIVITQFDVMKLMCAFVQSFTNAEAST